MNTEVTLREWETLRPEAGSPVAGVSFGSNQADRILAEQLTRSGRIGVLELARGLELQATSFVGRFRIGGITVTIQPKLTGVPLLNLLRYAYGLRQLTTYEPVGYTSARWTFQDLLILQLIAEVSELMARGIHRDYVRSNEDLASPRGRVDFKRYVQVAPYGRAELPCIHHPRTEDTFLNQVVLSGLVFAESLTTYVDLRAQLRRLAKMLRESVSLRRLDRSLLQDARREMDRRTTAYDPTLKLIELLLGMEGISFEGEKERIPLPGFLFDMNRFFQALMSRFLKEHLPQLQVRDEYRLKGLFRYAPGPNPRPAPILRPDFVVMENRKIIAVLDAKYRDLWEKPLPREMLYQLSLYALGRSENEKKAAILYPTMDSSAREQTITIHEPVSGSEQASVDLRPINLKLLEALLREGVSKSEKRTELALKLVIGG